MTKRSVGSATTAKLDTLGAELVEATKQRKYYESEEARIKAEIATLVAKFQLPIQESKSEWLNLSDGGNSIRITRPAPRMQKLLTLKLLGLIRDRLGATEGNAVFLDTVVLPENCVVDVDKWNKYVEDETLINSLLLTALEPEHDAPKPSVQLANRKRPE